MTPFAILPLFAAVFLSNTTLLAGGLAAATAVIGGLVWYRIGDKAERRRETAIDVQAFFAGIELEVASKFFRKYAAGDRDGAAAAFGDITEILADPEKRLFATRKAGLKIAEMIAADDAEYAKLLAVIRKARLGKKPIPAEIELVEAAAAQHAAQPAPVPAVAK